MLVATFVACFTVFYDLLNPFYGGYQVSASVDQLYTIRLALKAEAELCLLDEEEEEVETACASEILEDGLLPPQGLDKKAKPQHTGVAEKDIA